VAEIKQGSEAVQVLGKLELQANRQYLFQGTLKPGPELPDQMKQGSPSSASPMGRGASAALSGPHLTALPMV
jgi:general secretion pathway protein N